MPGEPAKSLWENIAVVGGEAKVPISAYLCAYSIPEGRCDAEKLLEKYHDLGIEEDDRPTKPRVPDAFKLAVRSLEEGRPEPVANWVGAKTAYEVRALSPTSYALVRMVTGVPLDAQGVPATKPDIIIDKSHSFRMDLERPPKGDPPENAKVITTWYGSDHAEDDAALEKLRSQVTGEFLATLKAIDANRMRENFYHILRKSHAVPFTNHGAGVWLIPSVHIETLRKHAAAVEFYRTEGETTKNGGVRFWPVIDTVEMRSWVINDVQSDLTQRLSALMEQVLSTLKSGKPENWNKMLALRQEVRDELQAVRDHWADALGTDIAIPSPLDTATAKDDFLREVDDRIAQVLQNVGEEGAPDGFDAHEVRQLILEVVGVQEPTLPPAEPERALELGPATPKEG